MIYQLLKNNDNIVGFTLGRETKKRKNNEPITQNIGHLADSAKYEDDCN